VRDDARPLHQLYSKESRGAARLLPGGLGRSLRVRDQVTSWRTEWMWIRVASVLLRGAAKPGTQREMPVWCRASTTPDHRRARKLRSPRMAVVGPCLHARGRRDLRRGRSGR
jgi:hypothetical protein